VENPKFFVWMMSRLIWRYYRLFLPKGYEVIMANNGEEALGIITKQQVDLILLDIMMPDVDGFTVCRNIKDKEKFRNIPIVMITGLSAKEERIKAIEAGAEDFISKPFDQEEVLARIRMLLKVKGLTDDLKVAYTNINSLTEFGKETIEIFDPLSFDFSTSITAFVTRLIRNTPNEIDKPQIVLVGTSDHKKTWTWNQYEKVFNELDMAMVDSNSEFGTIFKLPEKGKSQTIFFNQEDIEKSRLQIFVNSLVSFNITISDAVCYLNRDICIFALNYGRTVSAYDAGLLDGLVLNILFLKSLSSQMNEVENAFEYTVYALARASEVNDDDTGNHILRVGEFSAILAHRLRMSDEFVRTIRVQSTLHDVGKIYIPANILKKPEALTPTQIIEMKKHTLFGAKIIGDHPKLKMGKAIALAHHERFDGTGYPHGLRSGSIPFAARIVNVADQYDAMRNARVYKPAFDHVTTYKIITEGDGRTIPKHFDPIILKAFRDSATKLRDLYEEMKLLKSNA
jgi:response regulator RpfG family c-di-GMP phosphodiesterase